MLGCHAPGTWSSTCCPTITYCAALLHLLVWRLLPSSLAGVEDAFEDALVVMEGKEVER
jgi:hypothetical protein